MTYQVITGSTGCTASSSPVSSLVCT